MEKDNLIKQGAADQAFNTAGQAIQQGHTIRAMQTNYATAVAVQKPRDLKEVLRRCIEEAEIAGDLFYYRWETQSTDQKTGKVKKSIIEGPSVNLALTAVRNFGNSVVQQCPVQETRDSWIFTAAFIDLETGFTIERQFRMAKDYTVYGKMDKNRKDDIKFQIGQSKAIRNVVNNAMPAGIISKMIEAAKNSARKIIEERLEKAGGEIQKVIDPMLKKFDKYGVTPDMIERKLGIPMIKWDIDDLTMLAGDLTALASGNETAEALYAEDESETEPDKKSNGLSTDDMKPGDPATHQGYDTEKKPGKKLTQTEAGF